MTTNIPGYQYQLDHLDEDKGPTTTAVASFLIASTTVAVILRLIAQRLVRPNFMLDDYLVVAAWVIAVGLCVTLILCVHYGLGRHVIAVEKEDSNPPTNLINVFKTGYTMSVAQIPALYFIKMSLLLFYKRVFTTRQRRTRIALWLVGGYVTAWAIAVFVVFVYQCDPIPYFWDRSYALAGMKPPESGTCLPSVDHQLYPGIFNTLGDLLILVLPGVALWPLQMKRSKKFGLFFIFSLGAFVCGVTIAKIVFIFTVDNSTDSTYVNNEILLWTVVECCVGLKCACIPCMMPLSRLVSMGPRAAFNYNSHKGSNSVSIQMMNARSKPFPGGRKLESQDDVEYSADETPGDAPPHLVLPLQGVTTPGGVFYGDNTTDATGTNGHRRPSLPENVIRVAKDVELTSQPADAVRK